MKTAFEFPDDLVRTMKIRAAKESRKLKDLVEEFLRRGLDQTPTPTQAARRVRLPLVVCTHPARAGEEPTPERTAHVLLT